MSSIHALPANSHSNIIQVLTIFSNVMSCSRQSCLLLMSRCSLCFSSSLFFKMSLERLTKEASFAKETAACLKAASACLVSTGFKVRGSAGPGFWLRNRCPPPITMTQVCAGSFLPHTHKVRRTTQPGLKAVKHQQKFAPGLVQSRSYACLAKQLPVDMCDVTLLQLEQSL